MPSEQGLGLDEESASAPTIKQPTQSGEQRSIGRPQGRSGHLTTEHGNLVSEHDDFDRQLVAVPSTEADQLEDSDEGQVEKRQGHGPVSSSRADPRKSCSGDPDDILGTHRHRPHRRPGASGEVSEPVPLPIADRRSVRFLAVAEWRVLAPPALVSLHCRSADPPFVSYLVTIGNAASPGAIRPIRIPSTERHPRQLLLLRETGSSLLNWTMCWGGQHVACRVLA